MLLDRLFHRNKNGRYATAKTIAWTAGAAGTAIAASASLPTLWTQIVNFTLRRIPGYSAHVDHVEFNLFSGRLLLRGVSVDQVIDRRDVPLLRIETLRIHVSWKSLMRGRIVGEIDVSRPRVQIDLEHLPGAPQKTTASAAPGPTPDSGRWQEKIQALMPFQMQLTLTEGQLGVLGVPGQEAERLSIQGLELRIKNLTNSKKFTGTLMAFLECQMQVLERGALNFQASGYPLSLQPTFNVDAKLQNLNLVQLSPFLQHIAGIQVRRGIAEAYLEAAAKGGQLQGYVKPVIDHLDIAPLERNFKEKTKGRLAEGVIKVLQNRKDDRIATTIDFEGPLDHPTIDIWGASLGIIKNAFRDALDNKLENRVWFERLGSEASEAEIHYHTPRKSRLRVAGELIKDTAQRWTHDAAPRMAAALSYYTAFSIAPLLLLVVSIAGLVFGKDAAQGQIVTQMSGLIGHRSAAALQSMIQAAHHPAKGALATAIGLISLLAGATGVLSELKSSLNHIWGTDEPGGITALFKQNIQYFGIIFAIGFLLLVSLAVSAAVAATGKWVSGVLPVPEFLLHLVNSLVSLGIVTLLFGCIYKILPNTWIAWKDVWVGSAVTAFLFELGKIVLGLYLGKGTVGSSYGAAGSILIILLWVYYSGLIFYFGAEFTKVYADRFGSRLKARL
jgi:membrane protein